MTERRLARRYDLSLPVNIRMPINREPRQHSENVSQLAPTLEAAIGDLSCIGREAQAQEI